MIQQLFIKDFAVIDSLELEFGPGLNILTGETGSGKSIIVDAINIALGERADADAIRSGCERATVEAVLDVSGLDPGGLSSMREAGFAPEDGRVIVSRELTRGGKSQCRINGRPATVSLLKEITDRAVDIHGQHDHQSLLRPERHLDTLDEWCGEPAQAERRLVAEAYARLRALQAELSRLETDRRERAHNIDLYQFQLEEIRGANLRPGEEEELLADRTRLANAERLHAAASAAFEAIGDRAQDICALDKLSDAVAALHDLADLDPLLQPTAEVLQSALYQVEDASRELRAYRDAVEFSPERLEAIEERLDVLRALKRKYGETVEEIEAYGVEVERKLDALAHGEERTEELTGEIERASLEAGSHARALSEIRRRGGADFASRIVGELEMLSMPNALFEVSQAEKPLDAAGVDDVEFLISANPGEPVKPLAKIASGGEMSRIMLAVKSVIASADRLPTLIFDEIDVGIGGRTADVIGEKLQALAASCQVLCITHLPQIASRPADHFRIEKRLEDGRTVVRVRRLDDEERVEELSRMLGGADPSDTAVRHAREMLSGRGGRRP
ncbi:MAG: DNA repair protein RecN [Armatimonadetes bacterium]|nr:DNA repair protein RecN [Armatimonadota bacterium]